ncbi:MAG TPA: hypothetical protein VMZ91_08960, partial [Candidatus Paceibacterota bacterium]|nr:hypothetical protein [Candidatus Paceibacterota bacterium]
SDIYKNIDKYEIYWNENKLRNVWFTGAGQYGSCVVNTFNLLPEDIIKAKEDIEKEFPKRINDYWGVKKEIKNG